MTAEKNKAQEFDSKLVPILREGIDLVRMVLFRDLKNLLTKTYPDDPDQTIRLLTGAVVNRLFTPPTAMAPADDQFTTSHQVEIEAALQLIADDLANLRIPLTDALRTQVICDQIQGLDSSCLLVQAQRYNILLKEREAPMPARFIHMVRIMGTAYGLLQPLPDSAKDGAQHGCDG